MQVACCGTFNFFCTMSNSPVIWAKSGGWDGSQKTTPVTLLLLCQLGPALPLTFTATQPLGLGNPSALRQGTLSWDS